ncbi:MAG TPA: class I SAM-dependent methyltransferase [Methanotrichaceae archaeon]|nr:class I SAM-dependent methyltransferase [Methanotrichaceae archaeon]
MTYHEPWTIDYLEEKFARPDPWKYLTTLYEQTKYRRQIEIIKDRRPQPRKILEIGSAEGAHTLMLAESFPSARITAVEISSKAIDRAREKLENYKDRVELANADIVEYEFRIDDGCFDVCVWSESVYYVGARASLNETYRLLEKIVGKLVPGGILVMANTVDLPEDIPESVITKRPIMDCYYRLISSLAASAQKATYFDEKFGRVYEYQIWAFFRQRPL